MKTVEEVRRQRLLQIKAEFGTFAAINAKLNRTSTDATLSQIANSSKGSKTGKPKEMGSPQARALEEALGLERGLMDTDPDLLKELEACKARKWPFVQITAEQIATLSSEERAVIESAALETLNKKKPPAKVRQPVHS